MRSVYDEQNRENRGRERLLLLKTRLRLMVRHRFLQKIQYFWGLRCATVRINHGIQHLGSGLGLESGHVQVFPSIHNQNMPCSGWHWVLTGG